MLKQAWTLDDLARMCDIDPAGLAETVERFNRERRTGRRPRLRAGRVRLQPGARRSRTTGCTPASARSTNRRTTRSRSCRETSARAAASSPTNTPGSSDQDDRPIQGLYATGNGTATVMGRHYLGPGASIANTMVFGYVAARHATGADVSMIVLRRASRHPVGQ